ncbi:MAG: FimV family protein, partial [Sphingomonadaceae bacterium]
MQFTPFSTFLLRAGTLVFASLLSVSVLAAELGDASVRSYIGQQLSADIELVALTPEDLAGLQVRLAQPNVYQGANITMNPALAGVRMSVVRRDQRQFLHITTFQPIEADYLHLYLELTAGGRQEVRLATLWLQPDPHPAPVPAPLQVPSDAALVAARARASRPLPLAKPRVPLEAAPAETAPAAPAAARKALEPKELAAAIAARLPAAKAAAAAPEAAPAMPVLAAKTPPLKGLAAPAACGVQAAKECAQLDAHNVALSSKLGELEGKVKVLQLALEGKGPAPTATAHQEASATAASSASASAAASASAEGAAASASAAASAPVPTKLVKVLPKLKSKKDKPPEQGVSTGMLVAAGG